MGGEGMVGGGAANHTLPTPTTTNKTVIPNKVRNLNELLQTILNQYCKTDKFSHLNAKQF